MSLFSAFLCCYKSFRYGANQSDGSALIRFVEYCLFRGLYGADFCEVLTYNFTDIRRFRKKEVWSTLFVVKDNAALLADVNDEAHLPILREKHRLLERLDDLGRRYLYVPGRTEEEAYCFFVEAGTDRYILKPNSEASGRGISFLHVSEETFTIDGTEERYQGRDGFHSLYEKMKREDILVEEYIEQHHKLNELFSNCVNVVRLYTIQLPSGRVESVGFPLLTCGYGDGRQSNDECNIRIGIKPDGALFSYGFQRTRDEFGFDRISKVLRHPNSGVAFGTFRVPYWEEAFKLVERAAESVPELTYIAWDVAISESGPVIVEGNAMPASYWEGQAYSIDQRNRGIKREYSNFLRAISFSKTLTPERIQEINEALSQYGESCDPQECDTVIVLGSVRCTSRIEKAFSVFRDNKAVRYILCGGTASEHPVSPSDPGGGMFTEAEYMRRYLMERGIKEERIFMDNTSTNTAENISCATKVMGKIGTRKAAVVSAWFHGQRVLELISKADFMGLSPEHICFLPACGQQTSPENWYKSYYGIRAIYHEVRGD